MGIRPRVGESSRKPAGLRQPSPNPPVVAKMPRGQVELPLVQRRSENSTAPWARVPNQPRGLDEET